jgi:hypothetical protein
MKILVLTDDFEQAKLMINQLEIDAIHCIDEDQLLETTNISPEEPGYLFWMSQRAAAVFQSYKFNRNLVIFMDMKHWAAVELIQHDLSILIYSGDKRRKLFYNPKYKTDFVVKNSSDLTDIKLKLIDER